MYKIGDIVEIDGEKRIITKVGPDSFNSRHYDGDKPEIEIEQVMPKPVVKEKAEEPETTVEEKTEKPKRTRGKK
jgi:hypothetical protein